MHLLLNASNRENILQIEYMKYSVYKSSSVVKLSSEIIPKAFFCSLVLQFGNCYKSGTIIYVLNQSLLRTFTLSLTFSFSSSLTHTLHSHPLITNSLTHSLTHPLAYSLTHSSSNSLTHPLTHSLTHSQNHYLIRSWY